MERRTPRLLLREFEAGDAPAVLRYQSDARYQTYYPDSDLTPASAEAFVRMFLDQQAASPRWKFSSIHRPSRT